MKILTERADAQLVEAQHMSFELEETIRLLRERHENLSKPKS